MHIGQGEHARFHAAERFLEKLLHLRPLYIAKDENDAVLCDHVTIAKFEQIFLREPLNRFDGTVCAQGVRMFRKERLPHDIARHGRQLLFLLLNSGNLDFFFSRNRFFRHGCVEQNVRKQFNTQLHIGLGDIDRNIEAIVASIARHGAADRFDLVCNLLRGARFGSFQQYFRHQPRDAICLRSLREKAATEHRSHRNQRQPPIFAHQKAQPIRELEFFNLSCRGDLRALGFGGQRTLRVQRNDRQIAVCQIICGDALNVVERHLLDSSEIIPAEIQIAR